MQEAYVIEPGERHGRRWRWMVLWGGAGVLALLARLFLSSDRDILALNSPYDEYWFVHSAARLVWGGNYNQMAFANLPVYSIWLALQNALGLPARLGIDLAWLSGAAYAAFALVRFSGRRWIGAAFWLLCAFHPLFIAMFDRALSETLLVVLMPWLLGAALEVWNTRAMQGGRRAPVATCVLALSFALAFHVRKEGVLFFVPLVLLGACSLLHRAQWWPSLRTGTPGMRFVGLPLLATLVLGAGLAGMNYLRWGVAVRYELAAPGYERAIAALNRIDAGPGLLHVTVTRKARQLAYEHSPTFRELQGFFEGEPGRVLAVHTAQFTGHEGEIGNGWFYWAVRDAGAIVGWHSSARAAETKYHAIANELEAAFDAGRLPAYPAWTPSFLDPDLGKWIGRVPGSSWGALRLVVDGSPASVRLPAESATPQQMASFIEIVGRRNPVPSTRVRGWIMLPPGASVGLGQGGAEPVGWTVLSELGRRPDVPGALAFSLAAPGAGGDDALVVRTADGALGRLPFSQMRAGAMATTQGAVAVTLGVDELVAGRRGDRIERWLSQLRGVPVTWDWLARLGQLYQGLNIALLAVLLVAVVAWGVRRSVPVPVLAVCGIAGTMVVSRAVLFGILDASSWNGVQARYMAPMIPVFVFMVAVAVSALPQWRPLPSAGRR
jgi:hypothetical protein